jgi:hypothetical protein
MEVAAGCAKAGNVVRAGVTAGPQAARQAAMRSTIIAIFFMVFSSKVFPIPFGV